MDRQPKVAWISKQEYRRYYHKAWVANPRVWCESPICSEGKKPNRAYRVVVVYEPDYYTDNRGVVVAVCHEHWLMMDADVDGEWHLPL